MCYLKSTVTQESLACKICLLLMFDLNSMYEEVVHFEVFFIAFNIFMEYGVDSSLQNDLALYVYIFSILPVSFVFIANRTKRPKLQSTKRYFLGAYRKLSSNIFVLIFHSLFHNIAGIYNFVLFSF